MVRFAVSALKSFGSIPQHELYKVCDRLDVIDLGVSISSNPPIARKHTNDKFRCSSVVERPLCI
jgi:hypothetical protein